MKLVIHHCFTFISFHADLSLRSLISTNYLLYIVLYYLRYYVEDKTNGEVMVSEIAFNVIENITKP